MKAIYPMSKAEGTFEEKLEPALQLLASPWKLWESDQITLRRMVLKLAFTDRITYHRNQGARTTKITLLFKVLGNVLYRERIMVQLGGEFSNSSALPLLLRELEDWEAVLKAEPEVIHKLYSFEATVVAKPKPDKQRRVAQSPPRLHSRGPSR